MSNLLLSCLWIPAVTMAVISVLLSKGSRGRRVTGLLMEQACLTTLQDPLGYRLGTTSRNYVILARFYGVLQGSSPPTPSTLCGGAATGTSPETHLERQPSVLCVLAPGVDRKLEYTSQGCCLHSGRVRADGAISIAPQAAASREVPEHGVIQSPKRTQLHLRS